MIEITTQRTGIYVVAWHQPHVMTVVLSVALTRRGAIRRLTKKLGKQYGKKNNW